MNTVEEILAAMRGIVDAADAAGAVMTEDQEQRYADLEKQLTSVKKTAEVRARQDAYEAPNRTIVTAAPQHEDAEVRAFERYLRTGQAPAGAEFRAQSEGTPSEGGYLVPQGYRAEMIKTLKAYGGIANLAQSFDNGNGGSVEWPTMDDTANTGVIVSENTAPASGADLVFGTNALGAYTYAASGANGDPLRIPRELLQDSAFDLQGLVMDALAERIGRSQAVDFATGNGVGKPKGILDTTRQIKLATANDLANAANGYAKILAVYGALDPAYEDNAVWVFNKTTWVQLMSMEDEVGRPLLMPNAQSGIGGKPGYTLLGYPVYLDNSFPSPADNTNFAVFGDVKKAYIIRRVLGVEVFVNPYSRANQRQVEFNAWARADATIQNRAAFVTLAGKDA